MSISRRGILRLFGAGAASAATGVRPHDAAKALGLAGVPAAHEDVMDKIEKEGIGSISSPPRFVPKPTLPSLNSRIEELHDRVWAKVHRRHNDSNMPLNIKTKKSWSAEFKDSCWQKEEEVMRYYFRKLQSDRAFAKSVIKGLGIVFDETYDYGEDDCDVPKATTSTNLRF